MRSSLLSLAVLPLLAAAQKHGSGAEGTVMGPVQFLWPSDRLWDAKTDNVAPCGSPDGPKNRTTYPLSQGSVALSIADEAYKIAFRLAIGDNPTKQSDFDDQIVDNVTEVDPGHQCYKIEALENIREGTNATIQLEYWADFEGENDGKNQSFFACADITFVETKNFKLQVPCFNVTSKDFEPPETSGTPATPSGGANLSGSQTPSASSGSSGLSKGAKAGIAVGVIVAGLAIFGAIGFFLWRRGRNAGLQGKDQYELRAKNLSSPDGDRKVGA
ncbi:uncharacterized protein K460DRAFT_366896 [Cucurbitaria berberidis CBS 394.84]|uniref:Copper acquisition factor BIM1-like domain-containing protein n=1 Tax=Cucurbitaria berberidis CBS 394.84 TaxID=1168544 RepID=A0A9P4GJ06_9PLEO|nr:uncharacterized protein K460DRAFT_366896 [Cucurbitaria berberidis CBS 394.84]KAF1846056.1 hypothetical protein K460DRAFT_366896 [Cucurbitaria berberidis CBS 394.84]